MVRQTASRQPSGSRANRLLEAIPGSERERLEPRWSRVSLEFKQVAALGPDDDAPLPAKCMAAVSLLLLAGIMCAGRMLTFFRPPY